MKLLKYLWSLVANESGQIPSSLTDNYDALLTTTLRAMEPRMHDNITRGNKVTAFLRGKGRWRRQDGGERVKIALMHAQSSSADIYSGYGTLDTTPQDGITSAFFEWAQLAVTIAISRKEERQNSGRSAMLNLLQAKTQQAEASITELLNNCIVAGRLASSTGASNSLDQFQARIGRLDSGATGPLPLAALIDGNASRSVSIGNINGATFSFWQNQATRYNTTTDTFAAYKQDLSQVYNDCSRGVGGAPDLLISDQRAWEIYYNSLQNQERYVVSDPRTIDMLGGSGEDMIKFRGATWVWDEVVPDVSQSAEVVDSVGTVSFSTVFFLNSNAMEWVVDSSTDFITTPFVRPENQDARVAQILWMGAIGMNNRRKLGVLHDITRTITS